MKSRPDGREGGFTLIEAVIAIMIISIAVVTLVGALATMIKLSEEHRGHAVAETATRSFGQAVQALAQSSTPLSGPVSTTITPSMTVTDASILPPEGSNSFVLVNREIMRLTSVNRTNGALGVVRAQGGSTAATHATGAAVVPLLHCPEADTLTPPAGSFQTSTGVTATISSVEYWRPSSDSFVSRSSCLADYEVECPSTELRPECSTGLFRVGITVTTTGDARLSGIGSTTRILVRSGSA